VKGAAKILSKIAPPRAQTHKTYARLLFDDLQKTNLYHEGAEHRKPKNQQNSKKSAKQIVDKNGCGIEIENA
jgi:hypothetical protein